jgi:glycosyltransferase involved in cell wall biosynthesis
MIPVSVVIITKNEDEVIANCINAARLITDDIIVIDNGSTDQTLAIALNYGCNVYQNNWAGYGANKNMGIALAKYDWIFSIDADEVPDIELVLALHDLKFDDEAIVYDIKYRSYFGKKRIKYGHWGRDHHIRLFNRKLVKWSEPKVHETLIIPARIKTEAINGYLHHYSVKDADECMAKAIYYAKLSADNYFKAGKKPTFINLYISPCFAFFVDYIYFLGVLDGKEGLAISKTIFKNKWLKYHYLNNMKNIHNREETVSRVFAAEYN